MDSYGSESKKLRDEDFDELMAACDMAKNAVKTENSITKAMDGLKISNTTSNVDNTKTTEPLSAQERTPRALDKLDSSIESDVLTVVEKDDNGFVFYKCRFCGLTFNYMNTLRAHERVHNISQPFICGKCGESYEFACQLEYHTQQHGDMKGYKCECGRTFFSYTEMLYHKHSDDLEKEKEEKELHGCPMFVNPTTSKVALLQELPTPAYIEQGFEPKHPLKVYSDVRSKPYICEYCSKVMQIVANWPTTCTVIEENGSSIRGHLDT